jgi:hypothetical protein
LSTHLIASSAFSLQPGQLRPLILTQLSTLATAPPVRVDPVPQRALIDPQVRATCATGLPVSRTSRTAPSLKSWSDFMRVSAIAVQALTSDGIRIAVFYTKVYSRLLIPLTARNQAQAPPNCAPRYRPSPPRQRLRQPHAS